MSINDLVLKVNDVLTGSVLIIALVGIGLLFTFKLGFIQIRGFKDGWNRTFGGLFSKKGDAGKDGMSSFQALATAIAAQVGTGNIARSCNCNCSRWSGSNLLDVDQRIPRNVNDLRRSGYGSEVQAGQ